MPDSLFDKAFRQQVYLERLKAGFVKGWNSQQAKLRTAIKLNLAALEIENLQDLNRVQLQKVLAGLRQAHLTVSAPAMADFLRNLPGLAEYAAGLELSTLRGSKTQRFPLAAVNSKILKFDKESLRPESMKYAESLFVGKNANAVASNMKPIVVDLSEGVWNLQDGRHRLAAAEKAGATEINVHFIEYDPADPGNRLNEVTKVVALGDLPFVAMPRFNAPTAPQAYRRALESPIQATGQLLETFVKGWPEADALRVSNLIQKGWGQGKTLMEMIREATGTKAKGYADGFLDVSRRHAGTVINTATQHVANAARMDVWERNGDLVEKYEWVSTLDRRTTQQCKSLDGQRFEPGKGPMPPIHPNCRSTTTAVLSSEFDFLDEGATRASANGYVDAEESYYSWLKGQSPEFQNVALGKTRARLFRDGGLTEERFRALNIGRDFEPLTLSDMKKIEPKAFARAGL